MRMSPHKFPASFATLRQIFLGEGAAQLKLTAIITTVRAFRPVNDE